MYHPASLRNPGGVSKPNVPTVVGAGANGGAAATGGAGNEAAGDAGPPGDTGGAGDGGGAVPQVPLLTGGCPYGSVEGGPGCATGSVTG